MFNYYKQHRQQKGQNSFIDIIQPRKYDIRERKSDVFQKLIQSRKKHKVNDPERKYNRKDPKINSLQHFSQSQFSVKIEPQIKIPPRALPKTQQKNNPQESQQSISQINHQKTLAQRARQFINRLKKMKEYNQGRCLILRKKQEERKQKQHKKLMEQRLNKYHQYKEQKLNRMMDKILQHEERTCQRLGYSVNKLRRSALRSKTENSQRSEQLGKNLSFTDSRQLQLPSIQNFKKRLEDLQRLTKSFVRYEQ